MRAATLTLLVAVSACSSYKAVPRLEAEAVLRDASGLIVATARFTSTRAGVLLALDVSSLPSGLHGIHLHETGRCEPPAFESAGGHLNPTRTRHGLYAYGGAHAGDMPNLVVLSNRTANVSQSLPDVTLGPGAASLLRPGGTALVIHAEPDDQKTDPSGKSGKRVACGVIVRAAPAAE